MKKNFKIKKQKGGNFIKNFYDNLRPRYKVIFWLIVLLLIALVGLVIAIIIHYVKKNKSSQTTTIPTTKPTTKPFNNETLKQAVNNLVENIGEIKDEKEKKEALKKYGNISEWDVSEVTDMSSLFLGKNLNSVDLDLSKWNINKDTKIDFMFSNSEGHFHIPSDWLKNNGVFCRFINNDNVNNTELNNKLNNIFGNNTSLKNQVKIRLSC